MTENNEKDNKQSGQTEENITVPEEAKHEDKGKRRGRHAKADNPDNKERTGVKKILAAIGMFIKNLALKIWNKLPHKEPKYYDGEKHQWLYVRKLLINSFFVYLFIEEFARVTDNPVGGLLMIVQQPLVFIYNWLIIFATMAISLLFKKRDFVLGLVRGIWVVLGFVNGIILTKRMTPFTMYDTQNLKEGMSIAGQYLPKLGLTLIFIAFGIAIIALVVSFFTCVKWKNLNWKSNVGIVVVTFALVAVGTFGLLKANVLSTYFGNIAYAYDDYGFPYGFINTTVNTGIRKPHGYSKSMIDGILKDDTKNGTNQSVIETKGTNEQKPNIIILQLESFTRAQDYHNIKVNNDPTPVFNSLMKNYPSGWFTVPACGAGTANTEFEVLTGISARFFGPGEYPYKGKLRKQTLESMAYVTKANGYNTAAMHDHRAVFYNRNEVYANLGFNTFTSVEYMSNVDRTPIGWAKDKVLTGNILDLMNSTPQRDFIHVVSVEGHGAYPTEKVFSHPYTTVTAKDGNKETKYKYEYYINECHEMDTFLGDLINKVNATGEPTIILAYGDHIPALDIKSSDYGNGNLYRTRYVLWNNIGLTNTKKNMKSYEMGARILKAAGMSHEGTIFDYEQTANKKSKNYLSNLKALSYDMLYGKDYTFGGKNPVKRVNMKMGFRKIVATKIVKVGGQYYIQGQNFTECSSVSLKGKVLKTVYLSPNLLALEQKVDPDEVKNLKVSQIDTKDDSILTTTNTLEEL